MKKKRKERRILFIAWYVYRYVPWNLHEPRQGHFDFGDAKDPMSPFLDLPAFLKKAKEQDLLAIVRPGPYICAEWDFGGLPR